MEPSTLMYNSYNPYGDFNSDIANIVETEKKVNDNNIIKYNKEKEKIIPLKKSFKKDSSGNEIEKTELDINYILENITFTLNDVMNDIFKKEYNNLLSKSKWTGYGYIFIVLYICFYISKL